MTRGWPGCEARATTSLGLKSSDRHVPVLLAEVIAALQPRDGGSYLDATFGAGGYTKAILDAAATRVIALDRDPSAIESGNALAASFAPRLELHHQPFGNLLDDAADHLATLDGIVFDLGVSSMQLDTAERGFSFQSDGPLDMRMSAAPGTGTTAFAAPSAAQVVNTASESHLADILFHLGEEKRSRAIARAILRRRDEMPITRTSELAGIVIGVLGRGRPGDKHPATRTFQALRLYVNDELGQLLRGLLAAELLLKPGGRLAVVTFHSLEDRIVKRFMAAVSVRGGGGSRHAPERRTPEPSFRIVNPKPISPKPDEIALNPRSRSGRLRVAERTPAPAWGPDAPGLEPQALGLPRID